MVMSLWWVSLLLVAVAALAWLFAFLNRSKVGSRPIFVANSEYLDSLPSVRRAQKFSLILRILSVAVSALLVVSSAILAGRISSERVESPEFASRDIVLCLDISGSMLSYDREIVDTFLELVQSFDGERVGLAVFNSKTRTVFPLTNDYALVTRELEEAKKALEYNPTSHRLGSAQYTDEQIQRFYEFAGPTIDPSLPPSLIADGVASCSFLFDQADQNRARFMVLSTDNEAGGEGIYTLSEAVDALRERNISAWTFYPGASDCSQECARELQAETERTGGGFWSSRDPNAIPAIITEIEKAQAVTMGAEPRVIRTDHPAVPFAVALVVTVLVIAVGWKGR